MMGRPRLVLTPEERIARAEATRVRGRAYSLARRAEEKIKLAEAIAIVADRDAAAAAEE